MNIDLDAGIDRYYGYADTGASTSHLIFLSGYLTVTSLGNEPIPSEVYFTNREFGTGSTWYAVVRLANDPSAGRNAFVGYEFRIRFYEVFD
jgi:hypothetical protein